MQKIVRQVGAKATDIRTHSKAHGVSIENNCGPSFLTPQEIPDQSASEFSECQKGVMSITQWFQSQTQGHKTWSHGRTNAQFRR